MAKVIAFSKNGNMLKIENPKSRNGYDWYFLSEKVVSFAQKAIKENDEVDFKFSTDDKGDNVINYISKTGGIPSPRPEYKSKGEYKPPVKSWGRSPEEINSIVKQAMMKSAAEAVSRALQGQLDVTALGDAIIVLYEKLYSKITSA